MGLQDETSSRNIYILKRGESAKASRKESLKYILKDEKEYLEGKSSGYKDYNSVSYYSSKKAQAENSLKKIKRPVSEYTKNSKRQNQNENEFEDENFKSERNFKIKSNPQFKCNSVFLFK